MIVSTYYLENFKFVLGIVGGLAFVLLTMRWPEFGIICYIALLSGLVDLGYLPALHLGPISLQIGDIILILLLGLVFLRATTQQNYSFQSSPLFLPLILFICAFLISGVNAILLNGVGPNTVFRTLRLLALWLMFIPTLQLVRDDKALRRFILGLLILTGLLLFGVLFPNILFPLLPVEEVSMGEGTTGYADFTRIYYAGDMILYAMIPVTLASLATNKKGYQIWRIGLLGFLLYWVYRTYFRQYWLTLVVACAGLFVILTSGERIRLLKRIAPVIILCIIVISFLALSQPSQVVRIFQPLVARLETLTHNPLKEASLQWRIAETRYALQKIGQQPILGIGLGNTYRPPMISESDTRSFSEWTSKYIENGYLYIALMMGLVGLLPFLWLCTTYLLRVYRNRRIVKDDNLRGVYLGFGVAFLGMLACNIFTPTFVIGPRLIFFPVSIAISEVILRIESVKKVAE